MSKINKYSVEGNIGKGIFQYRYDELEKAQQTFENIKSKIKNKRLTNAYVELWDLEENKLLYMYDRALHDSMTTLEEALKKGEKYIVVGDWVDGALTGKEWMVWDNGEMNIGEYDCGEFISGIYYRGAVKNEYKKEDDATQGYTLDTVLQINMSSLDDESIIQLFSNILGSTPLKVDEGLIWTAIGKQFCGLNVQAVWAMLNADGTISTVSYLMETNGYNNTSDLDANRGIVETLINRTNARLGKAGIPVLDGNRIAFSNFDENVITLIRGKVITENSTTYAYTWDDSYAVVVDVKRDSLSILFTAPKQLGS